MAYCRGQVYMVAQTNGQWICYNHNRDYGVLGGGALYFNTHEDIIAHMEDHKDETLDTLASVNRALVRLRKEEKEFWEIEAQSVRTGLTD